MKRLIAFGTFLLVLSLALYAQDSDLDEVREEALRAEKELNQEQDKKKERPPDTSDKKVKPSPFSRKYFEFGFGVTAGLANDFIGIGDKFKDIINDPDTLRKKLSDTGVKLNASVEGEAFFLNVNMQGNWSFGLFASVDGGIYANVPTSFLTVLAEENTRDHSPEDFTVSGGIFADVGLKARVKLFEKLKISIAPAFYVPVIYIPKSVISYEVDSNLKFNMVGKFDIYSAFSFDNKVPFNTASFFSQGGVDVSLGAEYALFPVLDVGTTIRHIPLVPADLKNHLYFSPQFGINGNDIKDWRLSISVPDGDVTSIYDTVSYRVLRPLRFDFYGLFKPLKTDLFVLRPNIGFTVLNQMNLSGKANFNWGIEARLNLKDLFRVSLGTGYEETLWKHRLGLALNLRAFELTLEAGLQSQRFLNSFMLNGATAGVGISFGW